jgi:hypothetical protein
MGQVSDLLVSRALELHHPTEHKTYGCGQNIHKIHWESLLLPEHLKDMQELWYGYLKALFGFTFDMPGKLREMCVAQMVTHTCNSTGTGLESRER